MMAMLRSLGERLAKSLSLTMHGFVRDRFTEERALAEKRLFLREKKRAIFSAVKHFVTKEHFIQTMRPLDVYDSDPVAKQFVQGVLDRFDEIEKEKANGLDWVYRELGHA